MVEYGGSQVGTIAIMNTVWRGIQRRHPDVPDVETVIKDGMGDVAGAFQWRPTPTVMIASWHFESPSADAEEILDTAVHEKAVHRTSFRQLRAEAALETLLHEAAHAVGYVRDVKHSVITWHKGQRSDYHTKAYGTIATELGLWVDTSLIEPFGRGGGYDLTMLGEGYEARYADELHLLANVNHNAVVSNPLAEGQ
jgi:hypothetical protein